jgi:lysocardiolipin and lysophospholipid acyltransferase
MPLPPMSPPRSFASRQMGHVKAVASVLLLGPALLLINFLQSLSVVLLPISRALNRRINRFFANTWWGMCVVVARVLYGTDATIDGDDVPAGENAIVLCNHQSMSDITVLFELAYRKGRLGDLKWYVKDILKWVPGIGWGMVFLDCIFVRRNWTQDKEHIRRIFSRILRDKVPVWIATFPEGTRLTPAKAERSRAYAAKAGLPAFAHVMVPRTKGVVATLGGLQGHLDAVYDVTIGYSAAIPTLGDWVKGYVPKVHLHVRRFPLSELPRSEEERADWVVDRFAAKDGLLEGFYANGRWPAQEA